jgi:hypothetical protein
MRAFQIIFNPTSSAELARMPKESPAPDPRGIPRIAAGSARKRFGEVREIGKSWSDRCTDFGWAITVCILSDTIWAWWCIEF